jgi:hypothetical protein
VRLRQPIDLRRFAGIAPAASSSRTALVLTNAVSRSSDGLIEDACRANGLDLEWIGDEGHQTPTPELAIAGARLVIGLGRSVLEGMAAGRAAYVYGIVGGDGWVTPERYPLMEADGFAGTSASDLVIDRERLTDDLGSWDEQMGRVNRDLAAAHHAVREHAIELVNLAHSLDASPPAEPSFGEELARLVRLEWQNDLRARGNLAEADRLSSLLTQAHTDLAQAQNVALAASEQLEGAQSAARAAEERIAQAQRVAQTATEELEAIRNTRRYRIACRIASPLDRMRARIGSTR